MEHTSVGKNHALAWLHRVSELQIGSFDISGKASQCPIESSHLICRQLERTLEGRCIVDCESIVERIDDDGGTIVMQMMIGVAVVESVGDRSQDIIVLGMLLLQQFYCLEGIHKNAGTSRHTVLQAVKQLYTWWSFHVSMIVQERKKNQEILFTQGETTKKKKKNM